jgi:NPCBM/NEW2 domain
MALRSFSALLFALVALTAGFAIGPSFGQSSKPAGGQLILLDGSAAAFQSLEIQAGKLSGEGVPANLTLDDLRRIELPAAGSQAQTTAKIIVALRGGGRIHANRVEVATEKCQIQWSGGEQLSLPVDLVRAIQFEPTANSVDLEKAIATPSAELDRVFIKDDGGKLSSVAGLIDSLDAETLKLEVSGQVRQVPRSKLFGLALAQTAAADPPPHCLVTFTGGSTLGGESLSLSGGKATLGLSGGAKAEFAWSAASRVTVRSRRVAFLSDLKPISEEQQPIVTLPLPAQRDKSVSGKPLTLGGRVFEKGIGVHARSSLAFATEKKWDVLAATIGLDAAAAGKGDCIFVVLVDGQPLFMRRMKGNDTPEEIQVQITGREQVTLVVEPGERLDLADHADWCDVRFLKN